MNATQPDVAILSVARSDGDARVERLVSAMVELGLNVEVHALAPQVISKPHGRRILRTRRGPITRLARALILPFTVSGKVLVVVDPDLFISARLARLVRRCLVVCDVFEDYTLVVDDRAWARRRLVRIAARAYARAAHSAARGVDLTLVADDHVPPAEARERLVVRNLPILDRSGPIKPMQRPVSAYVGDVRVSRGALEMINGVRATDDWELDIVGPIFRGDRDEIMAAVADDPRIRLHGRQSPEDSWVIVGHASVGLAPLHETPAYAQSMPTKVYEYANAGMAIISSPLSRPAALIAKHGFGVLAAEADDITATLNHWRARPEELALCRRRAAEWAEATLGGDWPPAIAAARIKTMVEKRLDKA
jgi:glycosyltransferase involved in cell wall biosynthesis